MANSPKNNKILLIVASCLAVAAIVLVIMIVKVNSEDKGDIKEDTSVDIDKTITDVSVTGEPDSEKKGSVSKVPDDNSADKTVETDDNTGAKKEETGESSKDIEKKTDTKAVAEVTKLCEYRGIALEYTPALVTEEEVDEELQQLKDDYTYVIDLPDRSFELGDIAIVTFEGEVDGEKPDELSALCIQDIIGSELLPKSIEDEIIGHRKGDKFKVVLDFPEDYEAVPIAAGKSVTFEIFLEDGFTFRIPEINDSFIKSATEYENLEAYREGTKNSIQEEYNKVATDATILSMKKQIVDSCEYSDEVDNEIKMSYVSKISSETQYITDNYYIDPNVYYLYEYGMSLEEYQAKLMEDSTLEIKYNLALDKIAEIESLTVSEEDFEKAFNKIYIDSGDYYSKASVYAQKSEEVINKAVNTQAKRDKAEELILSEALINGEKKIPW